MGGGYKIPTIRTARSSMRSISGSSKHFTEKKRKKPINILISHENRVDYHTQKAHRLAEWLRTTSEFNPIIDTDYFGHKEPVSSTEIDRRERSMVKIADGLVRLIAPSSQTKEPRHEGPQREVRKAIKAKKPVIEIFYQGAHDSPNRPIQERNYKYRIPIHLKRGESLQKAIRRGWDIYEKIKANE